MNKASKAFRRSSIRIKSFTVGHQDLNMIISDLKEVKTTARAFMSAQETAMKDLQKWASKEQNKAISCTFNHFLQLNKLYTEVQKEFIEDLNRFKGQFDSIKEAEQVLDRTKANLENLQNKELKLTKELKKNAIKKTRSEFNELRSKIDDTRNSMTTIKKEIDDILVQNEDIKIIRVKEGVSKLSESYIKLAEKSSVIFMAQRGITDMLPDSGDTRRRDILNVRFPGDENAKYLVKRAEMFLKQYKRPSPYRPQAPSSNDSPPPYSCVSSTNFHFSSPQLEISYRPRYDVPPAESLDQDMLGAIGGLEHRVSSL